jgi:carbonic anhydrase/acetyltransferase-like protein (isoleucine patch superfamily)
VTLWALDGVAPRIHQTAWVHPEATVIGRVTIGPEASIWPRAVLRGDYGEIRIGARTSIQDGTVLHTTEQEPTVIGEDCVVGHLAHLEGCTVGNRCLIGSNSVVLNRVVIGDGSLVGAGALVAEDTVVPPDSRALGLPARVRPGAGIAEHVDYAVALYVQNAARYRKTLTLVDP